MSSISISNYFKLKGSCAYRKNGKTKVIENSDIQDYQKFFPLRSYKNRSDIICKTRYRDFGRTYVRTIKNTKTGNSRMVVEKERF